VAKTLFVRWQTITREFPDGLDGSRRLASGTFGAHITGTVPRLLPGLAFCSESVVQAPRLGRFGHPSYSVAGALESIDPDSR
jgi:hypothetical protein